MTHTITLIPGDGIGPEVSKAVKEILAAAGVDIAWDEIPARAEIERRGMTFMQSGVLDSIRKNRVALKGPMMTAVAGGAPSINVGLRQALDLYANLRPVKNLEGVQSRFQGVDLVIIRENTEDLYAGLEHTVVPGVVESLKIITEHASTRIAKFAFEYARKHGRKKIHAIHKANIMKLSDGLFLTSTRKVAEQYPDIEYKELIIDNACMQMVLRSAAVRHAAADESLWRHHERPRCWTWSVGLAWCRAEISARAWPSSKRFTEPRRILRAKASRIPRRC